MSRNNYDIFISYRREGGAQYARTLQLMLERKGYKVFLDYDELKDGQFSAKIDEAIRNSAIFIIVLSEGALARCVNEGDWVRREIETAVETHRRIVPVNPDGRFDGLPEGLPEEIRGAIELTQHSEINFGQALNATVDLMVKNRIRPYVSRSWAKLWCICAALCILLVIAACLWKYKSVRDVEALKSEIIFDGQTISWADDVTEPQLLAIRHILESMKPIEGGKFVQGALPDEGGNYDESVEPEFETPAFETEVKSFYMGQYEVTVGQWNAIMGDKREGDPSLPVASVTFEQAKAFAEKLGDLTLFPFRLPTEAEWEYAAKGATTPEGFIYAGGDDLKEIAWYSANSHGRPQSQLPATGVVNDLFNMSGNVSEWCDTRFEPYDTTVMLNTDGCMVIRGGNYDSAPYELTVTHREPVSSDTSIPTLGFRLAMTKN